MAAGITDSFKSEPIVIEDNVLLRQLTAHTAEAVALMAGVAIGLRVLYVRWTKEGVAIAENRTSTVEAHARTEIVEQLKNELGRVSEQRLLVADQLLQLQKYILALTEQAGRLTTQVSLLTSENIALKAEITHLRQEVSRLHEMQNTQAGML